MRPLADAIAGFHHAAERTSDHGGADAIRRVIDGNARGLAEQGSGFLDPDRCAELTALSLEALARHAPLVDRRRDEGFVRRCHGDLHLRNIVLLEGRPVLFDAIEFNDEFSCIDVLYDLSFLLMDVWRRQLRHHANAVLNGYIARTVDTAGLPVLPLFLSCRAAVRAKTNATAAALQSEPRRQAEGRAASREYLDLALALLRPPPAVVVAIGGFSGSGKSTLARALAPHVGAVPGAVVLRSDEIRKRLHGVTELARLPAGAYARDISRRVYRTVRDQANAVAATGHSAVADAVYARDEDRLAIENGATAAGVPFVGLWLDAPEATLVGRVAHRGPDVSDADAAVIRMQHEQGPGTIAWHRIDASAASEEVCRQALAYVMGRLR
jgi:predicted kinase